MIHPLRSLASLAVVAGSVFYGYASDNTGKARLADNIAGKDQEATSTIHTVRRIMERNVPRLQFDPSMSADELKQWQHAVSDTMCKLMRHPSAQAKVPVMVKRVQRDGYAVERWLTFPLEDAVVPMLVLVPDGVSEANRAPGVVCIPGWGQPKEFMAGERANNYALDGDPDSTVHLGAMALHMVRNGLVAAVVDNPSFGELSDGGHYDYLLTSRYLLEGGWSYLGLTSWQHRVALEHLRNRPDVDASRLVVSGFSLGTEPLMVLGALEPDIYAFVYADIFCRTRERILHADKPDEEGVHHFPNTDEHLIPEFLNNFDFPDLVANLAPRHLICTEGGMDRDFNLVKQAYTTLGRPENFTHLTYSPELHPATPVEEVPYGLSLSEYYAYLFTAPHHFKPDVVMPWLKEALKK